MARDRLLTHHNLLKKMILGAAEVVCPLCRVLIEEAAHVVATCSFSHLFWESVGVPRRAPLLDIDAHRLPLPDAVPSGTGATFRLLCCWHLWKHHNGVVFRQLEPSLALLRKCCRDDAML
jgi:hypothetical protein